MLFAQTGLMKAEEIEPSLRGMASVITRGQITPALGDVCADGSKTKRSDCQGVGYLDDCVQRIIPQEILLHAMGKSEGQWQ